MTTEGNPIVLPCGHEVLDAAQIHYCEYVSLERLLALQRPNAAGRARDFLQVADELGATAAISADGKWVVIRRK